MQVGDGDVDNAYWGGDQGLPTPRPSYQINATKCVRGRLRFSNCIADPFCSPGTDAAAQASAAFSACSALYAGRALSSLSPAASLSNSSYASTLLQHAQQLYSFANNTQQQTYQKAIPSVANAYSSSGYQDELVIAELFLALASNSSDMYSQAVNDYAAFHLSDQVTHAGDEQVLNWDSKAPGAVILGAQINRAYPGLASTAANAVDWSHDAAQYMDLVTTGSGRGSFTNGKYCVSNDKT